MITRNLVELLWLPAFVAQLILMSFKIRSKFDSLQGTIAFDSTSSDVVHHAYTFTIASSCSIMRYFMRVVVMKVMARSWQGHGIHHPL